MSLQRQSESDSEQTVFISEMSPEHGCHVGLVQPGLNGSEAWYRYPHFSFIVFKQSALYLSGAISNPTMACTLTPSNIHLTFFKYLFIQCFAKLFFLPFSSLADCYKVCGPFLSHFRCVSEVNLLTVCRTLFILVWC